MRDLMVAGLFPIILFLCLRNTFSAYIIWGWSGLVALQTYLYGFMADLPYVQTFAIIALVLILVGKDSEKKEFNPNRTIVILCLFGVHILLCAIFAEPGLLRNWELTANVLKTFLYCLTMPLLVTSRWRIHAMLVMIALAIGFNAGLDGLKFIASGGTHMARGNTKLGDNNHFALIIVMVMPLILYLYQYSSSKLIRWGFLGLLIVSVLAVVSSNSRGGLIAMVALAVWVTWKSRRRLQGLVFIALLSALIMQVAPESWTTRMGTIEQAGDDASFMGRVTAWKRASAIAVEHPVFGGGLHAGQAFTLFEQYRYKPGLLGFIDTPDLSIPLASHSIYFEVLGDLGFLGLFIFLILIYNSYITRKEIKSLISKKGDELMWAGDLSDILAGSLMVYVAAGALLSAAYFELPYIIMMLMEITKQQILVSNSNALKSTPSDERFRIAN